MARTPKDKTYFELFGNLARIMRKSAEMFSSETLSPKQKISTLTELEHDADRIVDEVVDRLDRHQDPPLRDPEDLHELAKRMDDVIDRLKTASLRMDQYCLETTGDITRFSSLILLATREIERGIPLLENVGKNHRAIREISIQINALERQGDRAEDDAISRLSERAHALSADASPREIWDMTSHKEVVFVLESALNSCEKVGDFLERLKKKNA